MAKKETKVENIEETRKEPANVHKVNVKIEGADWTKALDQAFARKQKTVRVDGFRAGKVPRDIFEKKFGKEALFIDAADMSVQVAYMKAITDSKLIPVTQPEVDIKSIDENGVEFVFTITTKPEVVVKNYKGLNIKPEKVKVTAEEVNHELGHLLERYTELVVKEEGKVENGDIAVIDFEGFKDGVAFDGGKGENYSLEIGSNTFIPGFEEQVIGMATGEEKDLNVTFPEEYGAADLAGQAVVFKVKVNEIKQKVARELDEEFFEDLGMEGINSEETLKEQIKESIKAQKDMEVENKYVDDLLEAVAKNVEVDVPQAMVDEETDRLIGRFEEQMKMQGISLDLYYQFTQSNEEALRSQMEKEAYNNVLYRLMLEQIMTEEKIEVTKEEAEKEAEELAAKYQMDKDEFLKQFGGIDMVQYDLEVRKTIELLKELNK